MPSALYRQLSAIVETTKDHPRVLGLEVRGDPRKGGLFLAVTRTDTREGKTVTLVTAPFDPANPDEAAEDCARRLTLDGELPRGMHKLD